MAVGVDDVPLPAGPAPLVTTATVAEAALTVVVAGAPAGPLLPGGCSEVAAPSPLRALVVGVADDVKGAGVAVVALRARGGTDGPGPGRSSSRGADPFHAILIDTVPERLPVALMTS